MHALPRRSSAASVCSTHSTSSPLGGSCLDPSIGVKPGGGAVVGKVLITGRDVNIRTILEYRLVQEGHTVLVSENSTQALEQARNEQPDLIILDLVEPHEDGLGFLKQVRNQSGSSAIPVFVLSTYRQDELDSKGTGFQDVEFLLKPFSPRELVASVNRIVRSKCSDSGHPGDSGPR